MTHPAKAGEQDGGVKLVIETIGEDVGISLRGDITSAVFIPGRLLPKVVEALQKILHEKQEVQSW